MANQEHLDLLKQGSAPWNTWRNEHPEIRPDLSGADLTDADLHQAFLRKANLRKADLRKANLSGADLRDAILQETILHKANLREANLRRAILYRADLSGADLRRAILYRADLNGAILREADLRGANLSQSTLISTRLTQAKLNDCLVYGTAAWDVDLEEAEQLNLVITPPGQPTITVDNLEVAQFIYLLLNNQKIRDVINTVTSKVVLILGRFTPERKIVLDALRDELRQQNYLPVVFDFERPSNRNLTETVSTLAHMARFIIADLTDAKSIPQELERIVPRLRVPVQPLLHTSEDKPYALFRDFEDYPWVLPLYQYADQGILLQSLQEHIISPAEQKAQVYEKRRQEAMEETDKPPT